MHGVLLATHCIDFLASNQNSSFLTNGFPVTPIANLDSAGYDVAPLLALEATITFPCSVNCRHTSLISKNSLLLDVDKLRFRC